MNWKPEKRTVYTYKRKSDGHLYSVEYGHSSIIKKEQCFLSMANNKLWETVNIKQVA